MKPDKNFRLWKPYKRLLASCATEQRTLLKKIFIDEQLSYERFRKTSHKEKIAPSVAPDA